MVRAGVRPDISERVLGHVIAGVEGTYDRHSYADEKRDALERLAAMIERVGSRSRQFQALSQYGCPTLKGHARSHRGPAKAR